MKLRFHVFSNNTVSADLEYFYNGCPDKNGWYINGKSEKLVFGYNIFDTEFFSKNLKNIISQITTVDDLLFLGTQYKIPMPNILYPDIDSKNKSYRSNDMGLNHRNDLTFYEKLSYYKTNKLDYQKTYVYNCETEQDVALSELHYYITNGYKLTYCELCGKPFFTPNLKNKFCIRKGLDVKHPEFTCKKIRALQRNTKCASAEIKRIRKIIISTLERNSETQYNEKAIAFKNDEIEYKNSHLPSEYEQWLKDLYKKYVPNGNKLKASDTD